MNDKEIKELGNSLMGCGCSMMLIPLVGLALFISIMFVLSILGVIK
jgi:hypothetical protein